MGYGHIQKTNLFHQVARGKSILYVNVLLLLEPEYKIEFRESLTHAAKDHTDKLMSDANKNNNNEEQ